MAVVTINEVKKQPPEKPSPRIASVIFGKHSEAIAKAPTVRAVASTVYRIAMENDLENDKFVKKLLVDLRKAPNLAESHKRIYNFILQGENEGVLKGYQEKVCRFKGSAIGGMECHSPR